MHAAPIPLEVCLTSNIRTNTVPEYERHHFAEFYARSYPMVLCVRASTLISFLFFICYGLPWSD